MARTVVLILAIALLTALLLVGSVVTHGQVGDVPILGPVATSEPPRRATSTPEERARRYEPGPPWDGRGTGPDQPGRWTQAHIDSFTHYPLFWLGESFAGYNLQAVLRGIPDDSEAAGRIPPSSYDRVTFFYGRCTPEARRERGGRCNPPVYLTVSSVCSMPPEVVPERFRRTTLQTVRGEALMVGDTIWTGQATIKLFPMTFDTDLGQQAIQELRGAGRNAGVRAGDPLPPPDFGVCKIARLSEESFFSDTPAGRPVPCPRPAQWLGLYWRGPATPASTMVQACADADRLWVRRGDRWLAFNPDHAEASDQFESVTGEFTFLHARP